MFKKANHLLSMPGYVIKQPGSTTGAYVVAGNADRIHTVTPGKGGSLHCDRQCFNSSTKLCEHVLAVAAQKGVLKELVSWYIRSKAGPKITEMALQGGPKGARKKPSRRKKTNAKKPEILDYVDMLKNP